MIKYWADINLIDEEYQSTPLGMAARWGHAEMVKYLIMQGADIDRSGAAWASPMAWVKKKGHVAIQVLLKEAGAEE